MNKSYTLYFDMDGVLVDFQKSYNNLPGGSRIKSNSAEHEVSKFREKYLTAGSTFWANMDWIHGGKELFQTAESLFHTIKILSSAGTTDVEKGKPVIEGKLQWLSKHLPSIPRENIHIVYGSHRKAEYATPNAILVDDLASTIKAWNDKNGIGILHDSKNYKKSIDQLVKLAKPIKLSELIA